MILTPQFRYAHPQSAVTAYIVVTLCRRPRHGSQATPSFSASRPDL